MNSKGDRLSVAFLKDKAGDRLLVCDLIMHSFEGRVLTHQCPNRPRDHCPEQRFTPQDDVLQASEHDRV